MTTTAASDAIEFCVRFFRQLLASGVSHVVLSPGSRSTPLALGAHTAGLEVVVQLDERSGGFHALGLAKAQRRPVALVSTSGTAAANYLPAVIEASHSGVPLVVCSADRPPELRAWGAGQTIDQVGMFGTNVRWWFDAPVASESPSSMGADLAARAVLESSRHPAGPVHINFPFREPLIDITGVPVVPDGEAMTVSTAMPPSPAPGLVSEVADLVRRYERGVIIAGPADFGPDGGALVALARAAGWPVLAETTSQLRTGPDAIDGPVVATFDLWLRNAELAQEFAPELVFAAGATPTSKALRRWLAGSVPRHVIVADSARDLPDPEHLATVITDCSGPALAAGVAAEVGALNRRGRWEARWRRAEAAASSAITLALEDARFAEPAVLRAIADAVPDEAAIYLSNSMPVRDADALWPSEAVGRRFFSNRGAAGIDGMISAAAGAARGAEEPVVLVTGDLAFLHDLSGLVAVGRDPVPLVVVVLDNAGGGIFSMLSVSEVLPPGTFERLFTTPHSMDLSALAAAARVGCSQPASLDALRTAIGEAVGRLEPTVIHLSLDIDAGFQQRFELETAAQQAVEAGLRE